MEAYQIGKYQIEMEQRVAFIQNVVNAAGAEGIVYGNSGGKDSALVGILCKKACENTIGLIMPCGSKRNYEEDRVDAEAIAAQYAIQTRLVSLTDARDAIAQAVGGATELTDLALANLAPRLRMSALYAVAASENRLVAGTGNRSEGYMGYFTKWGDGAHDFNPIADLTVTEIYDFLRFLEAPAFILDKAPSAALFDGQTDEGEMGISYQRIDRFLLTGEVDEQDKALIDRFHRASGHKRRMPYVFGE